MVAPKGFGRKGQRSELVSGILYRGTFSGGVQLMLGNVDLERLREVSHSSDG